jgi:GPH family glycoside/pentoside/hexuronide:cation symporter
VANIAVIPLVKLLGDGSDTTPRGWTLTFLMLGIIAACLFLLCFLGTKERIVTPPSNDGKTSLIKAIPPLFKNKYWVICLITGLIGQLGFGMMGVNAYFAQYFLGDVGLVGLLSMFMMAPMLIGLFFSAGIINKIGKRNAVMWSCIFGLSGTLIQAINPRSFALITVGVIIKGLFMAPMTACGFAMLADVIDYHEWKTGVRSEGVVYSAASFSQKVGAGLGAAGLGWALYFGNFDPNLVEQLQPAMNAILFVFLWLPFITQIIAIICYTQYTLDKIYPQVMEDLSTRRQTLTKPEDSLQ